MSLEIIIGSMFSGKSTELIRKYNNYNIKYNNIIVITSILDNRYTIDNCISTHRQEKIKAVKLKNLYDINKDLYNKSSYIFIDESQFFNDLESFVKKSLNDNKNIILAGLNGDINLKPFTNITNLIPYAHKIIHLTSICHLCKTYEKGFIHYKINKKNNDRICIGGLDNYNVLCLKHYQKKI
jgi:thymidine kinase